MRYVYHRFPDQNDSMSQLIYTVNWTQYQNKELPTHDSLIFLCDNNQEILCGHGIAY